MGSEAYFEGDNIDVHKYTSDSLVQIRSDGMYVKPLNRSLITFALFSNCISAIISHETLCTTAIWYLSSIEGNKSKLPLNANYDSQNEIGEKNI